MEGVPCPFGHSDVCCGMTEKVTADDGVAAVGRQKQQPQPLIQSNLPLGSSGATSCRPVTAPACGYHRRRTRSTGSLPWLNRQSGESSSSMGEWEMSRDMGVSSLYQSDSDDMSGVAQAKEGHLYNLRQPPPPRLLPNIESDSVNENFSPVRPITRRKRKLKRMAVMEVELGGGGGSGVVVVGASSSRGLPSNLVASKKKRILRHCENRYCGWATSGKRKRSSVRASPPPASVLALHRLTIRDHQPALPPSSSSLSSSESDTGIFTNDEGREGDDEQSDWVGEASGGGWGGGEEEDREWKAGGRGNGRGVGIRLPPPALRRHHHSHHHHHHHHHHTHLLHLPTDTTGREIRGGRRRVRSDRAGFSILTSANEQLSRFLRDPAKSELRLHPMREHERHQLGHLADLYSLDMHLTDHHMGLTCPVLTKTSPLYNNMNKHYSNTMRVEPVSSSRLHITGQSKRRRRTPPDSNLSNSQQESLDSSVDNEVSATAGDEEDMSTEECAAAMAAASEDEEKEEHQKEDEEDTGGSLQHYSS